MGAAHHHAVQSRRMLGDVDHDGAHFKDGSVVGLQTPLGAVQGLRFGDGAFHNRSETPGETEWANQTEGLSPETTTRGWRWNYWRTVEFHADSTWIQFWREID